MFSLQLRRFGRSPAIFLFLFFFAVPAALAATATVTVMVPTKPPTRHFYTLWSGGTGYTHHDDRFSTTEAYYRQVGDVHGGTGILELPGVYFPYDGRTLIGFLPSVYHEDYSEDYLQTTSLALTRFNFDLSFWRYFGNGAQSHIGEGPFYRIDFGHSYLHEFQIVGGVESDEFHNGPNLKFSIGYGMAMRGYGFADMAIGLFAVDAGAVNAQGADVTVGFLL